MRQWLIVILVLLSLTAIQVAQPDFAKKPNSPPQVQDCGSLKNAYGPFNYNTAEGRAHWSIVRDYHFTPSVQRLQHGHTGKITKDLDYTLRAFPNQPLALYDMAVYQLQHGYPPGADHDTAGYYPADCYFKRAMRFVPKDGVVRMIYGIYLQREGDYQAALKRYKQAEKLIAPARSAELHYNMGLLFFALKDYTKARQQAKQAYARGYPLSGLRKQLEAVGQWSGSSSPAVSDGHHKQAR